ncbi:hypothetical protein [Actinopolyspora mortivallis]|uniref:hypothetical protein n=1 Tax=Actinopolyspora mortivallis TaxID=33906 RepID=UPI0011B212D4|nr:hypothetical protein [Actinopolyspora mortivallis]
MEQDPHEVLFSEDFVKFAAEVGLTGIEFHAVWDSELGSFGDVYHVRREGLLDEDVVLFDKNIQ